MGQHCLWDSEELKVDALNTWSAPCLPYATLWAKWFPELCLAPPSSRLPKRSTIFTVILLLAVPEAIFSHTESRIRSAGQNIIFEFPAVLEAVLSQLRSRSAVQSILCVVPRCPRRSLLPYKSKEKICGALLSERTVRAGCRSVLQCTCQFCFIFMIPLYCTDTLTFQPIDTALAKY